MPDISPKAVVENPRGLGDGVRVGPFSYIGPEVIIGPDTIIENSVTIIGRTKIGAKCHLMPCCVVGGSPAGVADSQAGECTVGDENVIREHVSIEAAATRAGQTSVGPRNLLMVGCQVGHDAVLDGEGIFANFTSIEHHARIEQFVRTAGCTGIAAYTTIGAYTFTTGYAIIDRDAPPYAIVQGLPFRVRGANAENLRRCGFDADAIAQIRDALRMIFDDGEVRPAEKTIASAAKAFGAEPIAYLIASVRQSAEHPTGRRLQPL